MEELPEEAYPELLRALPAAEAEAVLAAARRDVEWLGPAALCLARLWILAAIIAG